MHTTRQALQRMIQRALQQLGLHVGIQPSPHLIVHASAAPATAAHLQECMNLLKELGAPVEYIVLPTFAYEHKVFVAPFSRRFPKAKVRQACCCLDSLCMMRSCVCACVHKQCGWLLSGQLLGGVCSCCS
jgi:hypothetical protein